MAFVVLLSSGLIDRGGFMFLRVVIAQVKHLCLLGGLRGFFVLSRFRIGAC